MMSMAALNMNINAAAFSLKGDLVKLGAKPLLLHPRRGRRRHYSRISSNLGTTTFIRPLHNRGFKGPKAVASSTDFIAEVLNNVPTQVEPRYLVNGKLCTLQEKEMLQASALHKLFSLLTTFVIKGKQHIWSKDYTTTEVVANKEAATPVYLSDLLREYKGELFVPEEAFSGHAPEIEDFKRDLMTLPKMGLQDFLKALSSDQVELLTSRGIRGSSGYDYRDFVVNLKSIPGEKSLQRRKWAMHLAEEEAQLVLKEYSGPQCEVETYYTPYVMPPPKVPNPVAASVSGRVVMELTIVTGLISAVAFTIGGLASAIAFVVTSCLTVVVLHILLPLASPFLQAGKTLFLKLNESLWSFLLGGLSVDTFGKQGLPRLVNNVYGYFTSGSIFSNIRTLGAIFVVVAAMAALAKFTLTRRPKDFTKWDLWQAIEFGYSKPQARVEGSTGVLFEDVAGIDEVVGELQELVDYLKNPERFNQMGTKPPHGVLLEGPPGCGKTLLAKAIAGEAGVPFYQMAGSEFVEVLVGVGAARVRDLFKRAKVNRPAVVFIDEIDALGAMRQEGIGSGISEEYNAGSQERETTLNQLLIELDGFDTGKGVVFLGATNRMDMLDPALLRPGRFDRKVTVKPPRAKGRFEILKVHAKHVKLSPDVDLWYLAKNLPGWSGAQLSQLLQEGAVMAVRNVHDAVLQEDLYQAIDRLTMGSERLGVGCSLPVHRRIATKEIGLAMTSLILRRSENADLELCDHISIIPRGETLSRTIFERLDDDAYLFERLPQLRHRLQVLLGGRAAEQVMFGHDTSGWSQQHLSDASWLARKILTIWNLDGPFTIHGEQAAWSHMPNFAGAPLDFEGWLYDNYGFIDRSLNRHLDSNVAEDSDSLLNGMYAKILKLLQQHHAALAKSIYVILDKQEISGQDLELILDAYPAGTPVQLVEEEEDPGSLPVVEDVAELGQRKVGSIRANMIDTVTVGFSNSSSNGNGEVLTRSVTGGCTVKESRDGSMEVNTTMSNNGVVEDDLDSRSRKCTFPVQTCNQDIQE